MREGGGLRRRLLCRRWWFAAVHVPVEGTARFALLLELRRCMRRF
jgi:hypothetical protein